jgi:hypothetical protein
MTLLKDLKNHNINGRKIDDCKANWVEPLEIPLWVLCIALAFSIPFAASVIIYTSSEARVAVGALALALIIDILIMGAYTFLALAISGCGICVTLDSKFTCFSCDDCYKRRTYKFSGNEDTDAKNLERIITEFENYANELNLLAEQQRIAEHKEREALKKKSDACCKVYQSVVEKVKK